MMTIIIRIITGSLANAIGWTIALWIIWTWVENFEGAPVDLTLLFCAELASGGCITAIIASLYIHYGFTHIEIARLQTIALQICLLVAAGTAIIITLLVTKGRSDFPVKIWGMLFAFFSACALTTVKFLFL